LLAEPTNAVSLTFFAFAAAPAMAEMVTPSRSTAANSQSETRFGWCMSDLLLIGYGLQAPK
jgi:hypothetical protein